MSYSYDDNPSHLIELPLERVKEIVLQNKKGNLPAELEDESLKKEKLVAFENVVGQDDLTRFDRKGNKKKRRKKKFKERKEKQN